MSYEESGKIPRACGRVPEARYKGRRKRAGTAVEDGRHVGIAGDDREKDKARQERIKALEADPSLSLKHDQLSD